MNPLSGFLPMATPSPLEQIATALVKKNYRLAARLLKPLLQDCPQDPWVQLYYAQLQEELGKLEKAEIVYRKLLRETTIPKIALQARQGLQRLENEITQEPSAIAQSPSDPTDAEPGFLILEPLSQEAKQAIIPAFARLAKIDTYTARIQLSHRHWRLGRVGAMGELQTYGQALKQAGLLTFWISLSQIQQIRVFRVQYLQMDSHRPTVVCRNEAGQLGSLTFDWSEVNHQIKGLLPIFEQVVDLGPWNKLKRREETQDYAHLWDLHLPQRKCILRFCDRTYRFQQGIDFSSDSTATNAIVQNTTRLNWNRLLDFLKSHLQHTEVWQDFTPFAETSLDSLEFVADLDPHIDLLRQNKTVWDVAFHLYSSLIFLRDHAL